MISSGLIIRSIQSRVPFYTKPVLIKKKLVTGGSYPTVYVGKSTRCYSVPISRNRGALSTQSGSNNASNVSI